jgi:hypothetical protein
VLDAACSRSGFDTEWYVCFRRHRVRGGILVWRGHVMDKLEEDDVSSKGEDEVEECEGGVESGDGEGRDGSWLEGTVADVGNEAGKDDGVWNDEADDVEDAENANVREGAALEDEDGTNGGGDDPVAGAAVRIHAVPSFCLYLQRTADDEKEKDAVSVRDGEREGGDRKRQA